MAVGVCVGTSAQPSSAILLTAEVTSELLPLVDSVSTRVGAVMLSALAAAETGCTLVGEDVSDTRGASGAISVWVYADSSRKGEG